jgi:hypothetical protein
VLPLQIKPVYEMSTIVSWPFENKAIEMKEKQENKRKMTGLGRGKEI